jgi:hypothetical protein
MSTGFFVVGAVIFSIYMYFTIWNINRGAKAQQEENERRELRRKYSNPSQIDYDGMGDFTRMPISRSRKKSKIL